MDIQPAYSPLSGMIVGPAGQITYDFDGHVHGRGIDLDAGANSDPPTDNRIRWIRQSDGSVIADVYAFRDDAGAGRQLVAMTRSGGPADPAFAVFGAQTPSGVPAQILCSGTNPATVDVQALGATRTLIDSLARSRYVQTRTLSRLELAWDPGLEALEVWVDGAHVMTIG